MAGTCRIRLREMEDVAIFGKHYWHIIFLSQFSSLSGLSISANGITIHLVMWARSLGVTPDYSYSLLSQLPHSVSHQVLSVLSPNYLLDPIVSHLDYRSSFLSGMYVSSLAHPFFKHKSEVSMSCLTPFSNLDSGQMPLNDLRSSPQSRCSSPRVIMWKQYSREILYKLFN